jgi:hypothetical protein
MKSITINGREFTIEFSQASQGHCISVMEWDGDDWQTLPDYNGVLCLMQTQFETLCNLSSDLFGEAVWGEVFALELDVPMITGDDMECVKCHRYEFYEDMKLGRNLEESELEILDMSIWDYVCLDCLEAVKVGV